MAELLAVWVWRERVPVFSDFKGPLFAPPVQRRRAAGSLCRDGKCRDPEETAGVCFPSLDLSRFNKDFN